MTDDDIAPDTPAPEPAGPAEVVHPGGAPARPAGRTVRIGCAVLMLLGVLGGYAGGSSVASPQRGVCGFAVEEIDDADDPPLDTDDIDCDEEDDQNAAIAAAEELNGDDDLPSKGAIRTTGYLAIAVGLIQLVGGFLTLRMRTKRARLVALVGAGLGVVFLVALLFPFGILALGFTVYALLFSSDARAVFGDPGGPRLFRPRR